MVQIFHSTKKMFHDCDCLFKQSCLRLLTLMAVGKVVFYTNIGENKYQNGDNFPLMINFQLADNLL